MTNTPAIPSSWQQQIDRYLDYAANEKQYSQVTLDAYQRHLTPRPVILIRLLPLAGDSTRAC